MKRSIPLVLGFALVAMTACPAFAQRGRNSGVTTPYGHFSAAEMSQAGGNPLMAQQMREQTQVMQYEQQLFKQQQQSLQQMAKQQEFLKKHPEAAKALNPTARPTKALNPTARPTKKATTKASKKAQTAPTDASTSTTKNAS